MQKEIYQERLNVILSVYKNCKFKQILYETDGNTSGPLPAAITRGKISKPCRVGLVGSPLAR